MTWNISCRSILLQPFPPPGNPNPSTTPPTSGSGRATCRAHGTRRQHFSALDVQGQRCCLWQTSYAERHDSQLTQAYVAGLEALRKPPPPSFAPSFTGLVLRVTQVIKHSAQTPQKRCFSHAFYDEILSRLEKRQGLFAAQDVRVGEKSIVTSTTCSRRPDPVVNPE